MSGGLDEIDWQLKLKYCHRFSACAQDARSLGWNLSMLCPEALGNVFVIHSQQSYRTICRALFQELEDGWNTVKIETWHLRRIPWMLVMSGVLPRTAKGQGSARFHDLFPFPCIAQFGSQKEIIFSPGREVPIIRFHYLIFWTACLPLPAWFRNCHHVVPPKGVLFTQRCRFGGS